MYHYQLTQKRSFNLTLGLVLLAHLIVLLYQLEKKRFQILVPNSSDSSIRMQLQNEQIEVVSNRSTIPIKKKIVKKVKKATSKKKNLHPKKIVQNTKELKDTKISSASKLTKFQSLIKNYIEPHYPRMALRRGITGTVTISLTIMGDGSLKNVRITKSSGHELLDSSALQAARKWSFQAFSDQMSATSIVEKRIVYRIN